jgi:hypothetical protein
MYACVAILAKFQPSSAARALQGTQRTQLKCSCPPDITAAPPLWPLQAQLPAPVPTPCGYGCDTRTLSVLIPVADFGL